MPTRFCSLAIVVLGAGCAAQSAQGPRPHAEFSVQDAALFDDGVDLIEEPGQLEGQWRTDWDRSLDQRIAQADLIATGAVSTLRSDTDLDHRTSYRCVLAVDHVFQGHSPGAELTLSSREGAGGYGTVKDHADAMLERKLVAFVRYAVGPDGGTVAHFHLSTPSKLVLDRIAAYEASQEPTHVQVIEHRQ